MSALPEVGGFPASAYARHEAKHAGAVVIEVELRYDERQLRLRERAKLAGGKLTVWSAPDSGTEVELTIPASLAYSSPSPSRSWLCAKIFGQGATSDS